MNRLLLMTLMALASIVASAQVKVSAIVSPEANSYLGFRAGADFDIPISERLSIVPGAHWQMRHRQIEKAEHFPDGRITESDIDTKAHFLTVPVRLGLKVYESENLSFQFLEGLYAAYGIGGTTSTTITELGRQTETSSPAFGKGQRYRSRFDYGLNIGAKATINKHYVVGLNSEFGFKRIYDVQGGLVGAIASIIPGVSTNLSLGLSVGYQF